jgi:peptidoglycan/xylan/chitin deacetylase (PgdA/CDA1 family)
VLDRHQVKATFFVIGRHVRRRPEIVREAAAASHVIGNHTYTHPNLIFRGAPQVRREIAECEAAVQDAAGVRTWLFRPPWGGRRPATLRAIRRAGYEPVMWSVTSYDWRARSAAEIAGQVARQVRGGDVILLHDGSHLGKSGERSRTVEATEEIVRRYRGEGYEFVTVPEMMTGG